MNPSNSIMDDVLRRATLSQAARPVAPASEFVGSGSGISSLGSLGDELTDPLIPTKGESKDDNVGKKARQAVIDEEYLEDDSPLPLSSVSAIIMTVILGGVGIASSAVSMVTMAAGGLCVLNSATLVKNQYEISKGKGYRQVINDLRKQTERLSEEVELLYKAVNDLQNEASLMQILFEEQLKEISLEQGISMEEITNLMKENEDILNEQKASITSNFLNGDMEVDIKNLPLLMTGLENQLASHGLSIDSDEFEEMVKENNDISRIIKCSYELLAKPSSKTLGLITINPEFAKGSLDVARGKRPSLTSSPKLEHRNKTVRKVMQGLSSYITPDSSSSVGIISNTEAIVECTSNEEASYFGLLKYHREYRWYLLSSLVLDAGEWFSYIACIAAIEQIYTINDEEMSLTSVSILAALRFVPNFLFSNIGGVFADSYDRRNIMVSLDILGSITVCFFLLAYRLKSIAALYVITFCQMILASLNEPARESLVPMLVDKEYLKKALTLTNVTWGVIASVGASTGGLVAEYAGINVCFLINSAMYLLSACFIWMIRGQYVAADIRQTVSIDNDTVTQNCNSHNATQWISLAETAKMMTDGFTYIRSQSWGALVFLKFCGCFIYGSADVLNVAFSEKIYTNGDSNNVAQYGSSERLGILFASQGIGCIVGPVVIETVTDMEKISSLEAACVVSYLLLGLGYFGMAGIEGLVPLCVFNSVRSAGSNIIYIYSSLMLQRFCSNDMLGRVMAVDYALSTLAEGGAIIAGGMLLDNAELSPKTQAAMGPRETARPSS
eukprot:scaffold68283_cov86-Cyclotella_meneghiniana.AAC.1